MHCRIDHGRWSVQRRLQEHQLEDGNVDLLGVVDHLASDCLGVGYPDEHYS